MMTVEVKINGQLIARAHVQNLTQLSEVSDYAADWYQAGYPRLSIPEARGMMKIAGHRRSHGVWPLVARVVLGILDQMTGAKEGKG